MAGDRDARAKAAEKEAAKAAKRAEQKAKRAAKEASKAAKAAPAAGSAGGSLNGDDISDQENGNVAKVMKSISKLKLADSQEEEDHGRSCTGVLASHPQSRDIQIDSFTLLFHGHDLLQDSRLELNFGRRYGLLGLNGCGKSTLLKALAGREVPIPEHIDMYLLDKEIGASEKTALQVCRLTCRCWRLSYLPSSGFSCD
jgi:ATP-binding cassette subfamily F protein 2